MARIASVNCGSLIWQQTFTYDAFGNITKNSTLGIGLFQPGYSTTTNQLTSLGTVTPTYDTDGRLTYDGAYTYGWDADSKLHTVNTSPSTTATYDALGRMVEKQVGSAYTQIVYSPLGGKLAVMSAQTLQKGFVPLPTGATAVYTASGLAYYRHPDHLGSSRLATTPGQALYSSTAYAPFGEFYDQAGTTDLSFTGDDQDTASGMYDTLFRKQMPVQGRWLTPDPAGLSAVDLTNPQSWNRYVYVANIPLSFVDPTGLMLIGPPGTVGSTLGGGTDPLLGGNGIFGGWGAITIYTWTDQTVTYSPEVITYGTNDDGSVDYLDPLGISGNNPVLSGGGWTATIISSQTGWGQLSPSMFSPGNNMPVVSAAPSRSESKVQKVTASCMGTRLAENFLGSTGYPTVTVAVHVAAVAVLRPAVASFAPGPGWVYAGAAVLWDLGMVGKSYSECKNGGGEPLVEAPSDDQPEEAEEP